jgi:uncharacterized protein YkwD
MEEEFESTADAQLIDAVAEAVVTPPDREARAAVLNDLVQEIDEVVKWRHAEESDVAEVESLETVVQAAAQHLARMHDATEESDQERAIRERAT